MKKMTGRIFVDTNVLLYANLIDSPFSAVARQRLESYYNGGWELWISRQIVREYLAVLSKLQKPAAVTPTHLQDLRILLSGFSISDEDERSTVALFELLRQIPCGGKQVHDANVVATMQVTGVDTLLTHNVADFTRFNSLIRIAPLLEPQTL